MYANDGITLDPTRGDVPGDCRIVAKAERGTDALRIFVMLSVMYVLCWFELYDSCRLQSGVSIQTPPIYQR